jgi:hypothetical protein
MVPCKAEQRHPVMVLQGCPASGCQYVPEQEIQDQPIAAKASTFQLEVRRSKRKKRPVNRWNVEST